MNTMSVRGTPAGDPRAPRERSQPMNQSVKVRGCINESKARRFVFGEGETLGNPEITLRSKEVNQQKST